MHLNAHLDVDLIAVEQEDELALMLELTAPPAPTTEERAPATLEVVLDRSGSMHDGKLEAALTALDALVARLDPADRFGLVVFDDQVEVVVPAGPLTDKQAVREALRRVAPGGMTNLSGGYLRGIQEARRVADGRGATLLLLSDGHANEGVTAAGELESIAVNAHRQGVTTGTLGTGARLRRGAHERRRARRERKPRVRRGGRLSRTADRGRGRRAALPDGPGGESDRPAHVGGRGASTLERPARRRHRRRCDGRARRPLRRRGPQAGAHAGRALDVALGLAKVADLELRYVELPSATEHTVEVPVHVNVVPGDQAAGRIPDPTVRSELSYQQAQDAKRKASDALRAGDSAGAARLYADAGDVLSAAASAAPPAMAADMSQETDLLRDLADRAIVDDASRVAKFTDADRAQEGAQAGEMNAAPVLRRVLSLEDRAGVASDRRLKNG
jgi:Uncharacterized protein containing a von Willebrand factor type A (vWA) domain